MSEVQQLEASTSAMVVKRFVQIGVLFLAQAVILFGAAGRLDWWSGWVYLGFYIALIAFNAAILLPRDKELIAERANLGKNVKGWDKRLSLLSGGFTLGILLIGGLNIRFGWQPQPPLALQVVGTLAFFSGYALFSWAMLSNRFFSALVRIQADRSHSVSTGGPYRYVRHPGYVGLIVAYLGTPLLLGSWWALIPGAIAAALVVLRTALEDATLQKELPGYKEFAGQTRYRLIPGIW